MNILFFEKSILEYFKIILFFEKKNIPGIFQKFSNKKFLEKSIFVRNTRNISKVFYFKKINLPTQFFKKWS